jgi:Zn-dependent protease
MTLVGFLTVASAVAIFLVTVTVHEYCHGLLANRLGDPTARDAGRLSLNPLRHIDPFWTVFLPLLLFISTRGQFAIGMAKPVPVNFVNLRNPKRDMIWVAAAGPAANFFLAAVLAFLFRLYPFQILLYAIYFNVGLGVFNLIPIPPLDGSRILLGLLPASLASLYVRLEPFGFLIVLVLYFSGALYAVLIPGIHLVCALLGIPKIQF